MGYSASGLATPQTIADVQDEQIERQRRRDVAAANRAAYDAAQADNRLRPNRISSFSVDGNGNFSRTESLGGMTARDEWGADYGDAQNPVYAGMRQLANRENAIKAHNNGLMRDTILSGWKIARGNGGRLQQNTLGEFSRNLGMDGKAQAVVGAGLAKNGDFVLNVATKGQDGRVSLTPRVITKRQMYAMGCSGDGSIVNEGDLSALGNELASSGYSANSLEQIPNWTQQRQARQAQAKNAELDKLVASVVQSAMKEGRDPKWEAARALLTNKDFMAGIHGEQRVGEDGKPLMTTDENGNEVPDYEPATDDDMMKSVDSYLDHYLGPRGGNGGQDDWQARLAAADALLEKYYGPRKLSPEEQEIVQRQRQNAVEDQRRADNMRGPQQLVRYTDANGRLVTGNGWIRDGRVYDANGYEVQGATPMTARYDAETGETRYEEMPRLEPAAAAQRLQGVVGQYGLRNDGKTYKGTGWLGELKLPNGGVATEYTMQSDAVRGPDGNRIDFPTLVPTLTKAEQDLMVNDIIPNRKPVPDEIAQKAVDFARMRLANGQSVFANDGQPPAQDGAALLQQMRGGGQPPAQGATQAAQGGATAQPQTPEDKARAALAKRRGNAGGSPMMPNATQGGNATDRSGNGVNASENPAPATRRLSNRHRLGIFKDSGGEYEENAGGFRTVTIGNYDYLSDEDRAANSKVARESKDADIDIDALLKLQEKANANKAEFDKKRLAEENAYRKSIASKNYTEKRMEVEIQKHMEEWDEKNDPRIVNNRDVMNGGSGPIRLF